jgi:hypothetical protein
VRNLVDHKIEGIDNALQACVVDEPGQGNACHEYLIRCEATEEGQGQTLCTVNFQNGPALEFGVNGITQEVLITICIDRLRSFQSGPYSCRENAIALTHLEEALMWLQKRTRDRLSRGVEGTNQK